VADLNKKIEVKQQIEGLLATLDRKEAFEVIDSIVSDYSMEIFEYLMENI